MKYGTGTNPHGATSADFNEDGILDLAVANEVGTVSVLLGQGIAGVGDGTFAPAVSYASGNTPSGVTSGDFNEDGNLDLAVANVGGNSVSILLGSGTGTFSAPSPYAAGASPYTVVTGDFNEDGILDLAAPSNAVQALSVLLGQGVGSIGDGTFAPQQSYAIGSISTGIAVADFNGDDISDLVATCYHTHNVAVLRGQGAGGVGNGTFFASILYSSGEHPFAVATGDFDEDGDLDIVAGSGATGGVYVLRNGAGAFIPALTYNNGTQNAGIIVGDFNTDGRLDLASADGNNNALHILLGDGTGSVGDGTFGGLASYPTTGAISFPMTDGDFNEDGHIDLVTVNYGSADISVFLGTCDDDPPPPVGPAPELTDVRDVPHDQGHRVFVTWLASELDVVGNSTITGYRVWRRVHPEGTAPRRDDATPASASPSPFLRVVDPATASVVYWEALMDLPAQKLEGYGYTAATTQDSMKKSNPYTAFFITALTRDPSTFYNSNVDSGYSVDNIKPRRPDNAAGAAAPDGYALSWDAPDPAFDPDITGYRIYRGNTPDFTIDAAHQVGETETTEYLHPGSNGAHHYKVTAVDDGGNEGDAAVVAPLTNVGVGDATAKFSLWGTNPARPSKLMIHFTAPTGERATLDAFDLVGRRVVTSEVGSFGAGSHQVNLASGHALRGGIYLIRLTQGMQTHSIKMIVTP